MKKTISLLLCLSIMLCMVPGSSFADTLVYEYPPVNAFLAPRDFSAMEMEFRQWAAKLIYMWWSQNGSYTAESDSDIEYCRLADTKLDFDGMEDDDNVYNWNNMSKSEIGGFYLWVFLESVKENMYLDLDNILTQYNDLDENDRRYWMYDPNTGELVYDSYSEQAQNLSDAERNANWAKAGSDIVLSTVSTVADYYIIKSEKFVNKESSDLCDLFNVIFEAIDSAMEQWIDALKTNNEIRISNQVRGQLEADLQEAVLTTSDAMIAHLKEAYIDTSNPAFRYSTWASDYPAMIQSFVKTVEKNRESYEDDLNNEVHNQINTPDVSAVFDAIDYDFVDTLDWKQIGTLVLFTAAKEATVKLIDFLVKKLEKAVNLDFKSFDVELGAHEVGSSLVAAFLNAFNELSKKAINDYFDAILKDAKNGVPFPSDMAEQIMNAVVNKISNTEEFNEEFAKQIGKEIIDVGADMLNEIDGLASLLLKEFFGIVVADSTESRAKKISKAIVKVADNVMYENIKGDMRNAIGNMQKANLNGILSPTDSEKINELDDKVYKLRQKLQNANDLFNIVIKVMDRWWETGISIQAALESTAAAETGEGVMSMLGSRMVTCMTMRLPMRTYVASAIIATGSTADETTFVEYFMNPEKISAEDIFTIISQIYLMNQYDIIGSAAYFNMVLHYDVFYKKVLFVSIESKFLKYIEENHVNRLRKKGLLSIEYATTDYNNFVTFGTYYTMPDQWYALFEH